MNIQQVWTVIEDTKILKGRKPDKMLRSMLRHMGNRGMNYLKKLLNLSFTTQKMELVISAFFHYMPHSETITESVTSTPHQRS